MKTLSRTYKNSETLLERALRSIPLGTQTFSKSKTQFPFGVSPFFITRGAGAYVWDADGNKYIDLINALAAVTLGYNDSDVNLAVRKQLDEGTIFSLPHPVEISVAEKLIEMVPCAEMVRFGKNGSDATSGAIRVARAFTGREHVAMCGYHGWHDWYIGATGRHLGVPASVRALSHVFKYNDLDSLSAIFQQESGKIAAVIMEPMNVATPESHFLEEVKALAHKHGALLIFDETITGFRFANGGAQDFFGVTPDLATFGKGLANGYPISAIAGRADVMQVMEDIFFSFTFGGETLSLAAALATMVKLQEKPVLASIADTGRRLKKALEDLVVKHELEHCLSVSGHPSWVFLNFRDAAPYSMWEIKTLFLQEIFERGLLCLGTHNLSYAHTEADISRVLEIYEEVFPILKSAIMSRNLRDVLRCAPLEPLFKIR